MQESRSASVGLAESGRREGVGEAGPGAPPPPPRRKTVPPRILRILARLLGDGVMGFLALAAVALAIIPEIFETSPRLVSFW